jgi:hypothetical protein
VSSVIGDLVWLDENGDGLLQSNEPGVAGVVVRLVDGAGVVADEAVTDVAGNYRLMAPGDLAVSLEVVMPDGFEPTVVDVGSDDAVDSDVDPSKVIVDVDETTVRVPVLPAADDLDWDIGLIPVAVLPATTITVDTEPATTQPATTQPATTQPATTEPVTTTTEPATTEPATTTTQPATTQPATTQPATTEPATTQPSATTTAAPNGETR